MSWLIWPLLSRRCVSVLDRVKELIPIQFRYIPDIDPDQRLRAGFSAQQVKALFPDAVIDIDGVLVIRIDVLRNYIKQAVEEQAQIKKGS